MSLNQLKDSNTVHIEKFLSSNVLITLPRVWGKLYYINWSHEHIHAPKQHGQENPKL